ncbi:cell division protein FtsX [Bartonella ancashensis]|uniref:Cell division protein FtsX n=1 Tax=Bartonella ancashensis TaxID=1318743 RepID=A0A0M3T2N8_9HYPH|nr:cell division protein FtsX [Bartonella ancashensis]ALE03171.1 Cell division protein FtsX [Bartonella ancashensis]
MNKFLPISDFKKLIYKRKSTTRSAIIPSSNISGQALVAVIAIMTFLSSLALSSVDLVQRATHNWSNQINREATIQIRPVDKIDIEQNLKNAVQLVQTFRGVQKATIVDQNSTKKLLEPWLGTDLSFDKLLLPRLIIVTLEEGKNIDFQAIHKAVKEKIPGGRFNDHRFWIHHFTTMAQTTILISFTILALILGSLMLTIIFATRNALAENVHIVNVLHFIGTQNIFIAQQFDKHFFKTALRGALYGGVTGVFFFHIFSLWIHRTLGTVETNQILALFGYFSINMSTYIKIIMLIFSISLLTILTSRMTILRQLKKMDQYDDGLF